MKFGDRRVCDQMVERVREQVEVLNSDKQLADRVKRRTDMLINKVEYRHETDAAPMRSSVAEIIVSPEREMMGQNSEPPLRVNVLEDDFWDLSQVLF
jgi:hypothetical protein